LCHETIVVQPRPSNPGATAIDGVAEVEGKTPMLIPEEDLQKLVLRLGSSGPQVRLQ
jgi:hypothetical protein